MDKMTKLKEKVKKKFPGVQLVGYDYEIKPYNLVFAAEELHGEVLRNMLEALEPDDFTIVDAPMEEEEEGVEDKGGRGKKAGNKPNLKKKLERLLEED